MNVWCFEGPDYIAFDDPAYIEPSVRLSYSNMKVAINLVFDGANVKRYEIRKPTKIGESQGELVAILNFRLYQVHKGVTHL